MKKLSLCLCSLIVSVVMLAQENVTAISIPPNTQGTHRVYAELLGIGSNLLGLNKNVWVTVDMGQYQNRMKTASHILDENGKEIKFNSMVAALNYMGERGWNFIQAYIVTEGKQNVYHWLMYKDISSDEELYEGLHVRNTVSEPEKKKKSKENKKSGRNGKPDKTDDAIYN